MLGFVFLEYTMSMSTDVQLLEPGDAVRLYEVDATHLGGEVMRFHGHLQQGTIIWQGQVYEQSVSRRRASI